MKAEEFITNKYGIPIENKDKYVKITRNDGSTWFHGTIDELIKEVEWQLQNEDMEKLEVNIKTNQEEQTI